MKTIEIISELQRIEQAGGGILQPAAIVEAARPISSPLHSRFEWDNVKASDEYRIWQARSLIRLCITVISNSPNPDGDRMWVSLKTDRVKEGGGYRPLVQVLSNIKMRDELLQDALDEFSYFQQKFGALKELAEVFRAMKKTHVQHRRTTLRQQAEIRA